VTGVEVRLRLARGAFTLDASFTAPERGVTAVFGASGAGKSTLLRAMAGLERGDGRVAVGDEVWQDSAAGRFLPTHRRPLGYVFQEAVLFDHLSVAGNLGYALVRTPRERRRVGLDQAVAQLGLGALLDRRPEGLSGGERQRVAMARALLRSPDQLHLDEPMSALDAPARAEILPYLERLHRELAVPVLYVSHSREEVLRLADHLVLLEGGRVAATGPLTGLGASLALAGAAAEDDDAGTMADAVVAGHDEEYALSWLEVGGLRVTLPRVDAAPGEVRRLRFHARDVSLARHRPEATSILNVFPARVVELRPAGPSQVLAVLRLAATGGGEGVPLLASITRRSAAVLELAPGDEVWAQVKAVALVGRPTAAAAPAPPPARP